MNARRLASTLRVAAFLALSTPFTAGAAGVPLLTAETKLVTHQDSLAFDRVGYSVAIDGETAVLGSTDSSAAYVFERIGGAWSLRQKLTAPDIIGYEYFGITVAINGDTIVVGAPDAYNGDIFSGNFTAYSGSAYVFVRTGGAWALLQKLVASDPNNWDFFGASLAIEGDTLAIGAPNGWPSSIPGAVYVFHRSGGLFSQTQRLVPPEASGGDTVGAALALSGDTLVAGAPDDAHAGDFSGSAYVFRRAGGAFSQVQKLAASDAGERHVFGHSVGVVGSTAVVGSPGNSYLGIPGAVYVFVNDGAAWSEVQKVTASDSAAGDDFAYSVALSETRLVVGAPTDSHSGYEAGSAYVFVKDGTSFAESQKLVASDAQVIANFGFSVATSGDRVLAGAPWVWDFCCHITGAAYVYEPGRKLTALSPARLWVGLRNSDDVGIRFDLEARVLVNGSQVGAGSLDGVSGGSSGFGNARLDAIPLELDVPAVLSPGDRLSLDVSVRNACSGSGKGSGSARLWFNGAAIDSGPSRGAGSRLDTTFGETSVDYFLRQGFSLGTTAGSQPLYVDAAVGGRCGAFVPLGTWNVTLP